MIFFFFHNMRNLVKKKEDLLDSLHQKLLTQRTDKTVQRRGVISSSERFCESAMSFSVVSVLKFLLIDGFPLMELLLMKGFLLIELIIHEGEHISSTLPFSRIHKIQ